MNTTDSADRAGLHGPAWNAYKAREDLKLHKPNGLVLFVSEMLLDIEDTESFAAEAITDHNNDKKCDLVYVSRESGTIVLAQNYESHNLSKSIGESKTTDLNTAVSWLLSGDITTLPSPLKGAALEARSAIDDGDITNFQIWSVHNLSETDNVAREVDQVKHTADSLIRRTFPNAAQVNVTARQIGIETIERTYHQGRAPILVSETLTFQTKGGYSVSGPSWSAYCTTIPADQLRQVWARHKTDLLSPNIRGYLGSRKSKRNINFGIKQTAIEQADDFMIFNNGITALVNSYKATESMVTIEGMGIVNGGQTTGSIGELNDDQSENLHNAWVQVRFISSTNAALVDSVVKYNNTQNKVEAADFRSGDPVQNRLRSEFTLVPDAEYRGGQRGGESDRMRRERNLLADRSVAQSLAAFHGDPNLAYNEARRLWEDDAPYSRYFNDTVSAQHIVLTYSLLKAIESYKQVLSSKEDRTTQQSKQLDFLSSRGALYLAVSAIAASIDTMIDAAIPNRFEMRFKRNIAPSAAIEAWRPVVEALMSFSDSLMPAVNERLQNRRNVENAISTFGSLVSATKTMNDQLYAKLKSDLHVA